MSADSESWRGRPESSGKAKVHKMHRPVDPEEKGLPVNLDAERFVLGAVLARTTR